MICCACGYTAFISVVKVWTSQALAAPGYKAISDALVHCTSLKRLSFAGSHMGDNAVISMQVNYGGDRL
jgi:hypothetical protein